MKKMLLAVPVLVFSSFGYAKVVCDEHPNDNPQTHCVEQVSPFVDAKPGDVLGFDSQGKLVPIKEDPGILKLFAAVKFDANGNILKSYNIADVDNYATGKYQVCFKSAADDLAYIPHATSTGNSSASVGGSEGSSYTRSCFDVVVNNFLNQKENREVNVTVYN